MENTHNRCGGAVLTPEDMRETWEIAQRYGIPVHLDGARIFNAGVFLGMDVRELTKYADSVSFCLSKGLSAPIGSVLCGTREFISRARKYRKMVGGGMRQAGVIAAPGIVALEKMVDRLAEDHENARLLANGLAKIPGIEVNPAAVQTNIVPVSVQAMGAQELQKRLGAAGVRVSFMDRDRLRLVTHYGISRRDIEDAVSTIRRVLTSSVVAKS
jgi:threonine aldolase